MLKLYIARLNIHNREQAHLFSETNIFLSERERNKLMGKDDNQGLAEWSRGYTVKGVSERTHDHLWITQFDDERTKLHINKKHCVCIGEVIISHDCQETRFAYTTPELEVQARVELAEHNQKMQQFNEEMKSSLPWS